MPCLLLHCRRRRAGEPFRGFPLYFVVIYAPLHFMMPGVPVVSLRHLWRGPRRREPSGSDAEEVLHDPRRPAPLAQVELMTPRIAQRESSARHRDLVGLNPGLEAVPTGHFDV
mmetsp:Transcript_22789/g.68311  ORF Transcript_22789/g.68311 Transcript_22789/m.68311 type:complete len:113 (+) Transcript_22789:614-952(+)